MDDQDMIERLTKVEERAKSNTHQIEEIKEKQGEISELVNAVNLIAQREGRLETDVSEIKSDVKSLKEVPGKRWNAIVEKVVMMIVGALVAYVLIQMGLPV